MTRFRNLRRGYVRHQERDGRYKDGRINRREGRPLWAEYLCDCDKNKLLVEFSGRRRSLAVDRSETKNECFSKSKSLFIQMASVLVSDSPSFLDYGQALPLLP
jgi:hypothetical protein